jgi:hypothetical protein
VVTDYVPYRYGRWGYVPTIGYNWVGDYPFSYVTSHYGRWRHHPSYGWCWRYRDVWGPAWVASYRVGPNFVWCPLDPWDRPVVWGNDYYYVGGLQFGVFATSYVPADYLFYGGHYINPFHSSIGYGIPRNQINIWNINFGSHRPHFPHPDRSMPVRDYAPRRSIRGPMALEREGTLARGRVERLESSVGRQRFETTTDTTHRSIRTPGQQATTREARSRSVRLTPEAASVTPEARGRRLATTDIGGIRERARTVDRAPSADGGRVEPGGVGRTRGSEPAIRDRSITETPDDGGGVPTERSRGSRDRSIRGADDTPDAPSAEPRSTTPDRTPSFRSRDDSDRPRERTVREPVDGGSREPSGPSRTRGGDDTPSFRRNEPSGPSSRSTDTPRRPEPPSIRSEPPQRSEEPSRRSVEVPQRSGEPSTRTPSRGRSSVRIDSLRTGPSDVITRAPSSQQRSIEAPRAQARQSMPPQSVPRQSAPQQSTRQYAPQQSAPQAAPRSMRSAPSAPAPSAPRMSAPAPQMSRPSVEAPRQQMPSPSPRMSAPSRSNSIAPSAPMGGGSSRGDGGSRGGIGGGGRSTRGR